jgi:ribosome-associated protein
VSDDVPVDRSLTIPGRELDLSFSPSGGPGGQHANRSSTRAELVWNIDRSEVLSRRQRERIRARLRHRIDLSGNFRLVGDAHRSQLRNREEVLRRLGDLVADALRPTKERKPTAPTRAARRARLEAKRRRSATKRARRVGPDDL